MDIEWKKTVDLFECLLDLERKAVGVCFLRTQEAYEAADGIILNRPVNYCQMVASATKGHVLKAKNENFNCRSGARVLGIDPTDLKNGHGENWTRLGLYADADLSAKVRCELVYLTEPCYGVLLAPIDQFETVPDVILIAANPYQSMRMVQGYAYHYGMPKSVNMIGNQAVCLECTARPYGVKDMNISLLCIGTRHRAGWKDDEMAVGIPAEQFSNVVHGLLCTMNQMESDANKAVIQKKMQEKHIHFDIRYGYNYYKDI